MTNDEIVNMLGQILSRNADNKLTVDMLNGIMISFKAELEKKKK